MNSEKRGPKGFDPMTPRTAYREGFISGWQDAMLGCRSKYDPADSTVDPLGTQYDHGYEDGQRAHKHFEVKFRRMGRE